MPAAPLQSGPRGTPTHGIAMHGTPALGPGFKHFPYASPNAPHGGVLRLGSQGSFDSLNPFIIKGNAPPTLRDYVYESLLARSADEPFTLYGLIAERIETPDDRTSVTFHLRSEAKFSDGHPITVADVRFSHSVLLKKGWPYHRTYYRKVASVEITGPRSIKFVFGPDARGDRELPLILGLMPVLPSHKLTEATFDQTTLQPPIGSGPYVVERVDPGRMVTFRKNSAYWARELAVQRGRFNFDSIRVDYYRDGNTLFEAFKAGTIDVRFEDDPGRWAEGYDFPAMRDGGVVKKEVATGLPAGMSGIVFNTRRDPLGDKRVRKALIQAFDAEWVNRNLYHDLYRRTASYFARSELASNGHPADEQERRLLAPYPDAVSPDVMAGTWRPPVSDGSGTDRAGLRQAHRLLQEAGYRLDGRQMVHSGTGKPLAFEFLAASREQERLVLAYAAQLKRLGIALKVRQVDDAQYWSRVKSFDFDLIQWAWPASLSPGNEQINRWSSRAAGLQGTLNFPGVKSPAADAMIGELLRATRREDFVSAVRALDRVLLSGDYVIPLFHVPRQWIAYHKRIGGPEKTPLTGIDLTTWWAAR
jgi:peptide/nickel transport system substrate-binding protein